MLQNNPPAVAKDVLLIVDSNEAAWSCLVQASSCGEFAYPLEFAKDCASALALLGTQGFFAVVVYQHQPDRDAFDFFTSLHGLVTLLAVDKGDLLAAAKGLSIGYDACVVRSNTPDNTVFLMAQLQVSLRNTQVLRQLRDSGFRFRNLTDLTSDWHWEQDAAFRFTSFGGQASDHSLLDQRIGKHPWELVALNMTERDWDVHRQALADEQIFRNLELQRASDDGEVIWWAVSGAPFYDDQGRFCGYRGIGRDITDQKRAAAEIERLAFFDSLTHLPNRRLLRDRLSVALGVSERRKDHGAVLFIDLDNFKVVNDSLGHLMGDELLKQMARRLEACLRQVDTVARLGGDEFVIMLEQLDANAQLAAAQIEQVAKKVFTTSSRAFSLGGVDTWSTPSIGATLFFGEEVQVDELLKRADMAMYQAKAAGRNTLRFFDPQMQAEATRRSALEVELRHGLERDELTLHFQPIVNIERRVTSVEALVRWQHPTRGLVPPVEFIDVAEQSGLIIALGLWVLEAACKQLVTWSAEVAKRNLSIAVNVSARQFRHPDFAQQILTVLRKTGANPYRLKLELTESLLLTDVQDVIEKMTELRSIGVNFSLDDFGTGYSSLSYLKRLPIDQLKIDQSFVRDVLTNPNGAAITRTILTLAKSLDLVAVAEGIETEGQMAFLIQNGCVAFQGYLFGKPVPALQLDFG